jgi:hypothetical protein
MTGRRDKGRFLILGCGHTGTTLISGIFHINGYGSFKISQDFENLDLNALNQQILSGSDVSDDDIKAFITAVEKRTGGKWSLKDPRLSETISRFYRHVSQPVRIVFNYRHPGATVRSLIKDRETYEAFLTPEQMLKSAEEEWLRRNRAILNFLDTENRSPLLMINYEGLVDRKLDQTLCRFVGHPLDLSFIEPKKRHSAPMLVNDDLLELYEILNRRSEDNHREVFRTTNPVPVRVIRGPTPRTRIHVVSNRLINGFRWRVGRIGGLRPSAWKHGRPAEGRP